MLRYFRRPIKVGCFCVSIASPILADLTAYPGCPAVTPSQFSVRTLVTNPKDDIHEPVKMDLVLQPDGTTDIYFIELATNRTADDQFNSARILHFDASANTTAPIGSIPVAPGMYGDEGGLGIALDPDFPINGWLYVYQTSDKLDRTMRVFPGKDQRVVRYSLVGGKLDPASAVIILQFPHAYSHTGSGIVFDGYGNLYIATGDQRQYEASSGNTADMRGKILRIKPLPVPEGSRAAPGPGATYSIPAGNFAEYWAQEWDKRGRGDLARIYRDPAKVLPEIFILGTRNPYDLDVDKARKWVMFGDCGDDEGQLETEEFTVATHPINAGYPYFIGNNLKVSWPQRGIPYAGYPSGPDSILNVSKANTGAPQLPPATPASISYERRCAMGGPMYHFDPALESTIKFPPHLDRVVFNFDYRASFINASRYDEAGKKLEDQIVTTGLLAAARPRLSGPVSSKFGPDGALYFISYGPQESVTSNVQSISRIEYTGPACEFKGKFEKTGCMTVGDALFDPEATHPNPEACASRRVEGCLKPGDTRFNSAATVHNPALCSGVVGIVERHVVQRGSSQSYLDIREKGGITVSVLDLSGKVIANKRANDRLTWDLESVSGLAATGVFILRIRTTHRSVAKRMMLNR